VNPLSLLVRDATWEAHQAAERAPFVQNLLAGRLDRAAYAQLVVQHHAVYEALEAMVASSRAEDLAPFLDPALNRLPRIRDDLRYLLGDGWRDQLAPLEATDVYCDRIRSAAKEWSGGLLAHHYVRYLGDLSGGNLIGRVVQRVYELPDEDGTRAYRFDEIPSAKQFKDRYRVSLDSLAWDKAARHRFIDEVACAYTLNTRMFDALEVVTGDAAWPRP
jgi:heme oxygenase